MLNHFPLPERFFSLWFLKEMETLYEPYSGQNNDPLKDVHTQILRTCE